MRPNKVPLLMMSLAVVAVTMNGLNASVAEQEAYTNPDSQKSGSIFDVHDAIPMGGSTPGLASGDGDRRDSLFVDIGSDPAIMNNGFLPEFPASAKNIDGLVIQTPGDLILAENLWLLPGSDPGLDGQDIWIEVGGIFWMEKSVTIQAAHGSSGEIREGVGTVIAGDAGRGGNVYIQAAVIVSHGNVIRAGDGGSGGMAYASGDPDATAHAGSGGDGGVVLVRTHQGITGDLWIRGGDGGAGGPAQAEGEDVECSKEDGRDETSWGKNQTVSNEDGGTGEANGTDASPCGPVDAKAGQGGGAVAYGGEGGTALHGDAGTGGTAIAMGGRSGHGADACFDSHEEAERSGIRHAGHGGYISEYKAVGGRGGDAIGHLSGDAGDGGFAMGEGYGGHGGNATSPIYSGMGGRSNPDGELGGVFGGNGGDGIYNQGRAGNGGGATGGILGGHDGYYCGPGPVELPSPGIPLLIGTLLALAWYRRMY